jgi:predicted phage tail protein
MNKNLVEITLHGKLGETVGKSWCLAVKSVGEAMRGIEVLSKHKLYKFLIENDKLGLKYRVLINKRDFISQRPLTIEDPESIKTSELCMLKNDLSSIDVIPVLEGSGDKALGILQIIIGVILILVAIFVPVLAPVAYMLIVAGLGLIAGGVMSLLSQPPDLSPYQAKQKSSYLFSGPANVVDEGVPVPIAYGELLVGSIVMSADYNLQHFYTGLKPGEKDGGTGGGTTTTGRRLDQN